MLLFTFVCPKYHDATASSSSGRQNPCEKSFQLIHHQDRDGRPSCTQSVLSAVNEQVAKCSLVTQRRFLRSPRCCLQARSPRPSPTSSGPCAALCKSFGATSLLSRPGQPRHGHCISPCGPRPTACRTFAGHPSSSSDSAM